MTNDPTHLEPYETHLLGLSFVSEVAFESGPGSETDLTVVLSTPGGPVRLWGARKTSHLTTTSVQALISHLGPDTRRWLLLAPHIGRPMGKLLREAGLNYIDASGNCFLALGDEYVATVEGRRTAKVEGSKGVRAAGARVLFALLAQESLLASSLRAIGHAADASHQAALDAVCRLQVAGDISREGRRRAWLPGGRRSAFDRWLGEYETTLRPWLDHGRYRTSDPTPEATEALLAPHMTGGRCWLGGLAAGNRLVEHYRGRTTVAHLRGSAKALAHEVRALKDPEGSLLLMKLPGPLATEGAVQGTVHPLLVYAEMCQSREERALEAASMVLRRYLSEFA